MVLIVRDTDCRSAFAFFSASRCVGTHNHTWGDSSLGVSVSGREFLVTLVQAVKPRANLIEALKLHELSAVNAALNHALGSPRRGSGSAPSDALQEVSQLPVEFSC